MKVLTRTGTFEDVSFDKIASRLKRLCHGRVSSVDVGRIVSLTASSLYDGISTAQLDELTAEISVSLASEHPDYGTLAARILISNWHKSTDDSVFETWRSMSEALSAEFMERAEGHAEELQAMVDYKRDMDFDFFAIRTFQKIYCTKIDGKLVERPQHVYLRVALAIGGDDMKRVRESYTLMSKKKFTHASPTLFNAGMRTQQLASCFLLGMQDSLDDIFSALHSVGRISKLGGGVGMHVSEVRSKGAAIKSTSGTSDGLVPMLRVANDVICYINQSGRRKGSMAIYLSPCHPDVMDFLELRRPGGEESARCRDLFLALWVPNIFMKRVEGDGRWAFFDPSTCPGLHETWGEEYEALYLKYEAEGKASRTMPARELWTLIIRSQAETGTPYLLYKDHCNQKSNQQNLGTIRGSNLCVAPETTILTKNGNERIEDLRDQRVEIWNGREWSSTTVRQTSVASELLRVRFTNGAFIECTPQHKFHVQCVAKFTTAEKEAAHLDVGDELLEWSMPNSTLRISIAVASVERTGRVDATYCFTEPLRHMGVFNGCILAGNCAEIIEYTSPEEVAVCTLASVSLPSFVKNGIFDFKELHAVTKVAARSLDTVIDINHYPLEAAKVSNERHRPIGIGVQGLADVYILLRMPFESPEAARMNVMIAQTMYHAAIETSAELAREFGAYSSYEGSPASQGKLQFDLWGVEPDGETGLDWAALKRLVKRYGLRNSLSIAIMPTASTSQLFSNTEAAEPLTSLIYKRRTIAGEFTVVNRHLTAELLGLGIWTPEVKDAIILAGGSVQNIPGIPNEVKALYKTAWEISMRVVIDQAAARGPYVCQSQSMNLWVADASLKRLSSIHFHAWRSGLKTGIYYLRTRPASQAKQVTVSADASCIACSS
jgi:ribonucleotide reductase alpha subunit